MFLWKQTALSSSHQPHDLPLTSPSLFDPLTLYLAPFRCSMVPCLWPPSQEIFQECTNVTCPTQRGTWPTIRSCRSKVSVELSINRERWSLCWAHVYVCTYCDVMMEENKTQNWGGWKCYVSFCVLLGQNIYSDRYNCILIQAFTILLGFHKPSEQLKSLLQSLYCHLQSIPCYCTESLH